MARLVAPQAPLFKEEAAAGVIQALAQTQRLEETLRLVLVEVAAVVENHRLRYTLMAAQEVLPDTSEAAQAELLVEPLLEQQAPLVWQCSPVPVVVGVLVTALRPRLAMGATEAHRVAVAGAVALE